MSSWMLTLVYELTEDDFDRRQEFCEQMMEFYIPLENFLKDQY